MGSMFGRSEMEKNKIAECLRSADIPAEIRLSFSPSLQRSNRHIIYVNKRLSPIYSKMNKVLKLGVRILTCHTGQYVLIAFFFTNIYFCLLLFSLLCDMLSADYKSITYLL